jgi:eukaryotic-like serine/threonine-protein kinase
MKLKRITHIVLAPSLFLICLLGCPATTPPNLSAGDTKTVMLPGNVQLVMVWIPPGTFFMGKDYTSTNDAFAESPQHQVTFATGFWMGKHEITKRQWEALMPVNPWAGQQSISTDPDSPAVYVSWNEAKLFVNALVNHSGLPFRLPSEAEWEYACRAGTATRYYWGDDPGLSNIGNHAWYNANANDFARPVGQKLPNLWGLHDMSGNALEWCEDDFHNGYTGAPADGSAWVDTPTRGLYRVFRGGSAFTNADSNRSGSRKYFYLPNNSQASGGFRVAQTP